MTDELRDHRLEDILAYQQGFLTDEERAQLEGHLRGCQSCQRTLEEVSRFLPALRQALSPGEVSTGGSLARAMAQMRARPPRPAPFLTRIRLAMLILAAAAAGAVLFLIQPLFGRSGAGPVAAPHRPSGLQVDAGADAAPDAGASGPAVIH